MSKRTRRLVFRVEADLEDYLQVHLSLQLSRLGLNLLIIGRQVDTTGGVIDLLAIDATGVIYIIELKLNRASSSSTEQLLAYRHSMKRMTRQQLIDVVGGGGLKMDLLKAFQRRFGHPLPQTVNASQVLVMIATSLHRRTVKSLLDLIDEGYSVRAFDYSIQAGELRVAPFNLDALDAEPHTPTKRRRRRARSAHSRVNPLPGYRARIDVEWFWRTRAHRFVAPLVTVESVHALYEQWVHNETPDGLDPLPLGPFARQLATLTAASGKWTRVYVPLGTKIEVYEPLIHPPSVRLHRDAGHWISAYQRTTVDKLPDTSDPRAGSKPTYDERRCPRFRPGSPPR